MTCRTCAKDVKKETVLMRKAIELLHKAYVEADAKRPKTKFLKMGNQPAHFLAKTKKKSQTVKKPSAKKSMNKASPEKKGALKNVSKALKGVKLTNSNSEYNTNNGYASNASGGSRTSIYN